METLGQKQRRFCAHSALLILQAIDMGYEVAFGEAGRSNEQAEINAIGSGGRMALADFVRPHWPRLADAIVDNDSAGGIRNSLHQLFLALDLKLFKDGVYLTRTEDYRALGEWWESQGPDFRWGGRFNDGNHFSIEHNGVK